MKKYVIGKKIVETYTVNHIWFNFMTYQQFSRVRQDKPECQLCTKSFKPDDMTHLAFVEGKVNQLICEECCQRAIDGGVSYHDPKKEI